MGIRWFGMPGGTKYANLSPEPPSDGAQVAWYATHSWRAWLMTGARRVPIDRRRLRGSDANLKRILTGGPSGAVDFSSAMARQAIDEAMNELPLQHRQVVKLAYFGGMSNREIALQLGLTLGGVRRRLRESLATVSAYVERGRMIGRRAVHGLVLWLFLRRFGGGTRRQSGPILNHIQQVAMVAIVTVGAAAVLVTHQASPGAASGPHKTAPIAAVAGSHLLQGRDKTLATVAGTATKSLSVVDGLPPLPPLTLLPVKVQVPVSVPIKVQIPPHLTIKVQVSIRLPNRLPVHLPALARALARGLSLL